MTTRHQLLLDAIAAAPDADEPRLVYADSLLEAGDRLGELIVAQLSQAKHPEDVELNRRVAQLISAHGSEVIGDLPLSKPVFRRGFVEAAEITGADFTALGARLFERLPTLAELTIWLERSSGEAKLLGSPLLARLHTLTFRYGRNMQIEALASNAALDKLAHLAVSGCGIGGAGCTALSESPHLAALRSLEIGLDAIGPPGALALGRARFAPKLRKLRLWKTALGPEGLASLESFTALETLDLGYNGFTPAALATLEAMVLAMPKLRSLGLRGNPIGPQTIQALQSLTLTHLDLEGAGIGDAGLSNFTGMDLRQLETLILAGNKLGSAGLGRLLKLPLPKLRLLVLTGNSLTNSRKRLARKLTDTRVVLDDAVLLPGR